jgi:hypothetical protein
VYANIRSYIDYGLANLNITFLINGDYYHLTQIDFTGNNNRSEFDYRENVIVLLEKKDHHFKDLIKNCLDKIFEIYDDFLKDRYRKRLALIHVMRNGLDNATKRPGSSRIDFMENPSQPFNRQIAELAGLREPRHDFHLGGGRIIKGKKRR